VTAWFWADPPYDTRGREPEDYPHVFSDLPGDSPHRLEDGSLCLFTPYDSTERRWSSDGGLFSLLNLTRDHLFFEAYWRSTGGHRGGVWLGPEAPHGQAARRSA
jgi:hypothetical protein